jgi:hypothetical protein
LPTVLDAVFAYLDVTFAFADPLTGLLVPVLFGTLRLTHWVAVALAVVQVSVVALGARVGLRVTFTVTDIHIETVRRRALSGTHTAAGLRVEHMTLGALALDTPALTVRLAKPQVSVGAFLFDTRVAGAELATVGDFYLAAAGDEPRVPLVGVQSPGRLMVGESVALGHDLAVVVGAALGPLGLG